MVKPNTDHSPNPLVLKQIEVLTELDDQQREQLAADMYLRAYEPKQIVISRNESSKDVYFIISGKVKATYYSADGKEVTFQVLEQNQMFGEMAAIDGQLRSTHVQAMTPTTLAVLPERKFWQLLEASPETRKAVMRRLTGLVRYLCEKIVEFSTLTVKDRIGASLIRMARAASDQDHEVEIDNPPTHADLACIIGTHREAVTKELKRLEKLGLIDWRPGRHLIHDVKALERDLDKIR